MIGMDRVQRRETGRPSNYDQTANRAQHARARQLALFSGKLPSMEAETDCRLQSNSS